jgi:putative transposase
VKTFAGRQGFADAITAVFPRAMVQTCIVHLIRHSLSFVSWQDRKRVLPALHGICRAETADMAEQQLAEFEAEWGKKYPPSVWPGGALGTRSCPSSPIRRRTAG